MTDNEKVKQEHIIGDILATGYGEVTSSLLIPLLIEAKDPPDLYFKWQELIIGVEVTELYQFQDQRSLLEDIARKASILISNNGKSHSYIGVVISFGQLLNSKGRTPVTSAWQTRSVKRPIDNAVNELVSLLFEQVPSAADIPKNNLGKIIMVDPIKQSALHALSDRIFVGLCGLPEKPEAMHWPQIIPYPGYTFDSVEMERRVVDLIGKKARSKIKHPEQWAHVNHSILVTHDLPRDLTLFSFSIPWEEWLRTAIQETKVLTTFDELWLVTFDNLQGRAVRIGGHQA